MFGKKKEEMMVYVVMGFLEAGKTSLIRDLIVVTTCLMIRLRHLFLHVRKARKNLREADLKKGCAVCEYIEDEDSFNGKVIQKFLKEAQTGQNNY